MTELKQSDKFESNTLCARPLWNSFPVALRCHGIIPPVPMHGCLSAVSIQNLFNTNKSQSTHNPQKQHVSFWWSTTYKGPVLSLSSKPSFTRPSTPMPVTDEFSSLAMNTAMTECFKGGLTSPSRRISWATSATWPRQSVVPRPRSLSLSSLSKVSEKGSKSCRNLDHQSSSIKIKNQLWWLIGLGWL